MFEYVDLYNPALDRTIQVPRRREPMLRRHGWETPAAPESPAQQPAPDLDPEADTTNTSEEE